MPRIHPKLETLDGALGRLPGARRAILSHAMECPSCRALLDQRRKGGEEAREEEPRRLPDYDDVLEKVFNRLQPQVCAAERERTEAPVLFAELMRHPPERMGILIRNSDRFRSFSLCELLLAASLKEGIRDPGRSERLARLALLIVDRLDAERVGVLTLEDARARSCALIGNALRAASDLHGAEQAFLKAEAHLRRGSKDRLERAQALTLKASLRRDQRQFPEAVRLLRRALSIWLCAGESRRGAEAMVTWATICMAAGEPELAIRILREAQALCEPDDLRLCLAIRHNLAHCLIDTGRTQEAQALLAYSQGLYRSVSNSLFNLRRLWLEGRIVRDLGRLAEAEGLLLSVRDRLLEAGNVYDAALVSLEISLICARTRRPVETALLARAAMSVFQAYRIPREALAARILIERSAEIEREMLAS